MKKKKIVYYNDEIKDDFSGTRIKQKPLKENFKYIKKGPIWCFFAWVLYYIFAIPFGAIFCFLKFRLKVENRKGKMEHFPLTSISIGVVVVSEVDKFSNVLEIGEVGAQVKHLAKKYKGSCYAIDRRKH